jgi:HlyD family secretion protein
MLKVLNERKRSAPGIFLSCAILLLAACDKGHEPGPDRNAIILSGTVEAREIDLSFRVNGHVERLMADEGDKISAADVVAQLDTRDFQLSLQRVTATADAAKAALDSLRAGTRKQEIRAAEADLQKARAQLNFAGSEVKRVERLVPKQLASEQQLEQEQLKQKVAKATVEQARQHLMLLEEGPRREDIQRAEKEYAARLEETAQAQQQLSYADLVSPVSGMITVRLREAGEMVTAGQPVLRVAELSRPWVRGYLSETDLGRVHLGQAVKVRVDSFPGKDFEGRLSFISPVAEFTPKTVETRELRVGLVYRIKVDVANPEGLLKIGMPADIIIEPSATNG